MNRTHHVNGPTQLATLAKDVQEPQKEQRPAEGKIKIDLLLFKPLADPDILAQCRNPLSKHARDQDGNILDTVTNHEYLELSALGKLWREAWKQLSPSIVEEVCFDLALPSRSENGDGSPAPIIYWDTHIPSEGGIGVPAQECINLIVTLATTLKIREGVAGVRYSLKSGKKHWEDEGKPSPGMVDLGVILERLSEYCGGSSRRA